MDCSIWKLPSLLLMKVVAWTLVVSSQFLWAVDAVPSYNEDVRPILSKFCFKCHGPDDGQRQAGLRLDTKEGATALLDSGMRAIEPGQPDSSEVLTRIFTDDVDTHMPPTSTKSVLTETHKQTLKRWVASGANYQQHWAYLSPQRSAVPPATVGVRSSDLRSPIDLFVANRLTAERLAHSPEASKHTLIRRASLDLIGLPPTPEETDEFVNDSSADAYERLIDRLMASPHYGERWGRKWLDLARYADTNGYEKDRPRTVWPYRDWVINSINADLPFDQFTIEQLAGDMIPNATVDQRIATGFHRNTMLNEEGGIDPLEFRYYAMTDRVATSATTWMGLTLGCAQCHTHKYDPITHRDYFGFFALLNNADEPEMEIVRPDLAARRAELQRQIAKLEQELPGQFPLLDDFEWQTVQPQLAASVKGSKLEILDDAIIFVSGDSPDTDIYEVTIDSHLGGVSAIRLEALADPRQPGQGPGRAPNGNFVLSEISARLVDFDRPSEPQIVKFALASADFSQKGFPVEKAIDGDSTSQSGWAVDAGNGNFNVNRTATFFLSNPAGRDDAQSRWTIRLDQQFGGKHTLGKFRLSLGRLKPGSNLSESERRRIHLDQSFSQWKSKQIEHHAKWVLAKPKTATSNLPLLTILDDGSILASGDQSKRDVYEVGLSSPLERITALRIEVMPDPSLPKNGPGRIFYEGPFGDFFLSEISLAADQKPVKFAHGSHSFANGTGAPACLDGNPQTGWSVDGGQGKSHVSVFRFDKPVEGASRLDLTLLFEKYYASGLGRFRVWVTDDLRPLEASSLPIELEPLLTTSSLESGANSELLAHFCRIAPELAKAREPIDQLKSQLAGAATALVMKERPANNPRPTRRHHRGEFLQPKELVEPAMLSMLPPLGKNRPSDRLSLAQWLVGSENPLTARVTVNRHWSILFGRGIVRSTEDFGSQGATPTHPELLDWLALEFMGNSTAKVANPAAWSVKRLQRMITSSATYRQSSKVSPELLAKDSTNELLARGPRFRLEAELVRDMALRASGLLSEKVGGPSVFPPQPASITTEGTYGALPWTVSLGEDRYRRSIYTYSKRTSPYAMFMTFDGLSGEACIARRDVTNTPLQALTMLNDTVVIEAAQALGREFASRPDSSTQRLQELIRRCVTRPATNEELTLLQNYLEVQSVRLERKELDAIAIAGDGDNAIARAAWTLVARTLLNLDETITKD